VFSARRAYRICDKSKRPSGIVGMSAAERERLVVIGQVVSMVLRQGGGCGLAICVSTPPSLTRNQTGVASFSIRSTSAR